MIKGVHVKVGVLICLMWCAASGVIAQVPGNAEDISPLLIGETVPNSTLIEMSGDSVSLHDVIRKKPTVFVVYRGGWCPFCNRHLGEVAEVTDSIFQLGYQIVAVSPDVVPGFREATIEQEGIVYQLLGDPDASFIKAMGIAFRAPDRYFERLDERSGGKNPGYLPVPSLFVLNTEGQILFEHISPNYKERMSSKLLLAVLAGFQ